MRFILCMFIVLSGCAAMDKSGPAVVFQDGGVNQPQITAESMEIKDGTAVLK